MDGADHQFDAANTNRDFNIYSILLGVISAVWIFVLDVDMSSIGNRKFAENAISHGISRPLQGALIEGAVTELGEFIRDITPRIVGRVFGELLQAEDISISLLNEGHNVVSLLPKPDVPLQNSHFHYFHYILKLFLDKIYRMIDRIVNVGAEPESEQEVELEVTLRPKDFVSYIGQERLKQNLQLAIAAATKRGEPLDHILLYGPPGLGKTTMASVIAHEMGAQIRVTSGPAIERAGDLASLLTNLSDGDILFIDEIHRLNRTVEEVLYSAMEDFKLDIMLGKGPSARSLRLDLPKFTIIGATTRTGALAAPLRDRFGMIHRLEFYKPDEIQKIIVRASTILNVKIDNKAAAELAKRARLTPRIANRLLKRVRDYADVNGDGIIDTEISHKALTLLDIDELGLDNGDRMLLAAIIENYNGGPVGVETLAALTAEERSTIEDFYEPYLMQIGLLERTPRGRKVTHKTYKHLGKTPDNDAKQAALL
jgi:Holliday junction DNA helicase RuvB